NATGPECEVVSHLDPSRGVYKKLVVRDNQLVGAILLGENDPTGSLLRLFRSGEPLTDRAVDMLTPATTRDALLGGGHDLQALADDAQICNCHLVSKGRIVAAIEDGKCSVEAIGECCKAGTGCGTCQPLLAQLVEVYGAGKKGVAEKNKVELIKEEKDGL